MPHTTTVALHRRTSKSAGTQANARVDLDLPQNISELELGLDLRALLSGSTTRYDHRASRHAREDQVCEQADFEAAIAV